MVDELVGREEELRAVGEFLTGPPGALVLEGPPGIGKTSLWQAGIAQARAKRMRVLVTRPSSEEAQLGFAGLADLFEDVDAKTLKALPAPQRHALEGALLLREEHEKTNVRAVAAAVLGVLLSLGATAPAATLATAAS